MKVLYYTADFDGFLMHFMLNKKIRVHFLIIAEGAKQTGRLHTYNILSNVKQSGK